MSQAQYLNGYDDGYAAGMLKTGGGGGNVSTTTAVRLLMIAEVDGELCYVKRPPYEGLPPVSAEEFQKNGSTKMVLCPPLEYYDARPLDKSDVIEKIECSVRYNNKAPAPFKVVDIAAKVDADDDFTPVAVCAYMPFVPLNGMTHILVIKYGDYCWIPRFDPGSGSFMILMPGSPVCEAMYDCPNLREMATHEICSPVDLHLSVFDPQDIISE